MKTLWPSVQDDDKLTPHQKEGARLATLKRVGILNGSPGVGKTWTTAAIVKAVIANFGQDKIAVACSTGKAAVKISSSMQGFGINIQATTIHRLLKIGRNGHDGSGWKFEHNANRPLPHRFIFIDEASMLDTNLASSLFVALSPGTHVLLIGDSGQLAPVGHGCPLRDMIASGVVPVGTLSEIQRNAGMIVQACASIKAGRRFETCEKYEPELGRNLKMIDAETPQEQLDALRTVLVAMKNSGRFDVMRDVQILCAVNEKSMVSRVILNTMLQGLLNPAADGENVEGKNLWRVDDKIICLRNCFVESADIDNGIPNASPSNPKHYGQDRDQDGFPTQHYLANGDQGRVLSVDVGTLIAEFDSPKRICRVLVSKKEASQLANGNGDKEGSGQDFALAYAITCHKSQGSEWGVVIVMADDAAGLVASQEFWYTALSRASKLCMVIGKRATVDKQCRRQAIIRRKTFLRELLSSISLSRCEK